MRVEFLRSANHPVCGGAVWPSAGFLMLRMLFTIGSICLGAFVLPPAAAAQDDAEQQQKSPLDSPFLVEPKTPSGLFDAARISTQLARPKLARQYLDQLLKTADDAALLQLREEYGAAEVLRLATNASLHPESKTLLQRMNAAYRASSEDPNRVLALINGLRGSASERNVALESLRAGGARIVPALLQVLADGSRQELHDTVTIAMSRLTRDAVPAVLAGADSTDLTVRTSSLVALGYLGDRSVVPFLWHPAFAPGQPAGVRNAARTSLQRLLAGVADRPRQVNNFGAAEELYEAARNHFRGTHGWTPDPAGNVSFWAWTDGQLTNIDLPAAEASQRVGQRLAKDAMHLAPRDRNKQALYLAFALADDSRNAGWAQPLPVGSGTAQDLGLSVGGTLLSQALDIGLEHDNRNAIRGALNAIWQVGDRALLAPTGGQVSPVRRALSHPDQRIQFAAANAVLNLTAGSQFAGSGHVLSVLTRALNSDGVVKCLVIDPNVSRADTLAALLADLGYGTKTAATGRDGFRQAAQSGDVSLIAVNANTVQWALTETIANLRADARTSGIPIVIYGPAFAESRIQNLLQQYSQLQFLEEPERSDDASRKFVSLSLKPFLETTIPQPTAEELTARQGLAAAWFAQLSGPRRESPYDLSGSTAALVSGVRLEPIAGPCLVGLGAIPTAAVQLELQKLAVDDTLPDTARVLAMNELVFHIQRNSMMLGAAEQVAVLKMAGEVQGSALSTAAAALAGAMNPDARRTYERLSRYQAQP